MMLTGLGYSKDFFQISHDDVGIYTGSFLSEPENDSRYDMQPILAGYRLERL